MRVPIACRFMAIRRTRASVVLYIIDGGRHTWPGSIPVARFGLTTQQVNASDTIWAFLAAHPLGS